ncbi:MAG: 1,4-dihydroxy-2-naphthoate polyprenyltransferase [Actinomycetes bacterium]
MTDPTPSGSPGGNANSQPVGWHLWLAGARPRTLPAAVVPVLVGTAVAAGMARMGTHGDLAGVRTGLKGIILWRTIAAMIVALGIQVGTNFANDYSDGVKGTDNVTRVGPLRLVGSGLKSPGAVKAAALMAFAVAACGGLLLALVTTWWLVAVGLVCFAAGWLYTGGPKPYGYYGFGELFVFVFFGLVATIGSTFVQLETIPWLAVACAVPVGALATALLIVNNLRDIPTDAVSGKRTLAVRMGDQRTRVFYVIVMVVPYFTLPVIAGLGRRPLAVLAFAVIFLAQRPILMVLQGAKGPALIPVLGRTGQVQLAFGLALAAGLFISG